MIERPEVRPLGRDGNRTMNEPYGLIEDAEIATFGAADQRDRHQQ